MDLFFVLSGFLVGGLILDMGDAQGISMRVRLLDFWQRRWLRTLPNYYLFLLLNVVFVATAVAPGLLTYAAWWYAVFLQNFHKPVDLFFGESWTLAVEEWFYILFPLTLFAVRRLMRVTFKKAFLYCAVCFCVVPLLVRLATIEPVRSPALLDLYVRKLVVTRLDTIGFGALAVWIARYFPEQWSLWRWPVFLIGLIALIWFAFHRPLVSNDHAALYFSGVAIAIGCLLPVLSNWYTTSALHRPVAFLSRVSYALYLVHVPMLHLLHRFITQNGPDPLIATVYWMICLLTATVVMYAVEIPFMRMRDVVGRRIRNASR